MSADDEGDTWDVDALKAVRVFFDPVKKKPVLKYLTSWLGFGDYWDEWTTAENFADPEQVTTFNKIIPAEFDRTNVGARWDAPKEWVDKEREIYFKENPHAVEKVGGKKIQAERRRLEQKELLEAQWTKREPWTRSAHAAQVLEDQADYVNYRKEARHERRKKSKLPPGESQKIKKSTIATSLPNRTKTATLTLSNASNADISKDLLITSNLKRPIVAPTNRRKQERIILGLRYKTQPLTHLQGLHTNAAFNRIRGRSYAEKSTPASRSTTSHQPRSKTRNDLVIYPPIDTSTVPANPESSTTDSLFDDSSEETAKSSDDSIPLAHQVLAPRTRKNRKAVRAISSDSSDSDEPLSRLASGVKNKGPPQKEYVFGDKCVSSSPIQAPTSDGLARKPLRPSGIPKSARSAPLNPPPNAIPNSETRPPPLTPIAAKMNAWKDAGTLIPVGQSRVLEPTPVAVAHPTLQSAPQPKTPQESPSPPLFLGDDVSVETHMEVDTMDPMPDPVDFMQSVVEEIPLPIESEQKTSWTPIDLILQSTNGEAPLCKVVLQKVTAAGPPSLKWIHKNGFKIGNFRSQSHLSFLLLAYEPWQHARLAAYEDQDGNVIDAFTTYLFENSMFALADTAFDGAKLCFYPSQSSAFADSLSIPTRSELRQGILRLLVTVIKPAFQPRPPLTPPIVGIPKEQRKMYFSSPTPAIERGLRLLRLTSEIKRALRQRYSSDQAKRNYVICSVESFGFRHPSTSAMDQQVISRHAANGVVHQEETLALIHVMSELGYEGKQNTESGAVVFIHNAAFDTQRHFLGLHLRKLRLKVWFFAYGPFHALEPRLWGVREIFKRGGVVTFTASAIVENVAEIPKLLQCIEESTIWIGFISPLVIGILQAAAINDPENQRAMEGLFSVLEAVKAGKLSIATAPPHPWKVQDWLKWLEANSEFSVQENLSADSESVQDAILDAAEKALNEFANPPPLSQMKQPPSCDCAMEYKGQATSRPRLEGRRLEEAVDVQVFEDLRQMLFMPVLHTEYRRFIVLRATQAATPSRDSIEHQTFQGLVETDRTTFGMFRLTKAASKPPPTPSSATSKHGTAVSPIIIP